MNASELVEIVAATTGLERRDVRRVLNTAITSISAELAARRRVTLAGFGTFVVRRRAARTTRHPRTGDDIDIPERDAVIFRSGTDLRETLRGVDSRA